MALSTMIYQSPIPYEATRMHAAAIYCSDGRIGTHFDDFMVHGLGLPRYDRLCLPGGPACLADHPEANLEEKGVVDELHFLVEVHQLQRVVLIAHEGCAFYSNRLGLSQSQMLDTQTKDLGLAGAYVHKVIGVTDIDAYFARFQGDEIVFEQVHF
jgi:hypothetical protein